MAVTVQDRPEELFDRPMTMVAAAVSIVYALAWAVALVVHAAVASDQAERRRRVAPSSQMGPSVAAGGLPADVGLLGGGALGDNAVGRAGVVVVEHALADARGGPSRAGRVGRVHRASDTGVEAYVTASVRLDGDRAVPEMIRLSCSSSMPS